MKMPSYAIDQIYTLLSSVSKPKYKDTKPTIKNDAEYIVINCQPITSGVHQKTHVNVNCHVKDITGGVPDRAKLDSLAQSVLTILEKATLTGVLIDYESSELIREENLSEHYMNLKFIVNIINL